MLSLRESLTFFNHPSELSPPLTEAECYADIQKILEDPLPPGDDEYGPFSLEAQNELASTKTLWQANLRHMRVSKLGETRRCSLCKNITGDECVECSAEEERREPQANTWLRSIGCHGRVGGHVTCFPCLKERQGIDARDFATGTKKVHAHSSLETFCGLFFVVAVPRLLCFQGVPLCVLQMLHVVILHNGSLSINFPRRDTILFFSKPPSRHLLENSRPPPSFPLPACSLFRQWETCLACEPPKKRARKPTAKPTRSSARLRAQRGREGGVS